MRLVPLLVDSAMNEEMNAGLSLFILYGTANPKKFFHADQRHHPSLVVLL